MKRRSLAAVLIATLVFSLTGCLRYSGIYYIQSDGTVSGQIYTALKEGYQTNSDPYKGTGAGDIAAQFPGATVTDQTMGSWYGYLVSFNNAPLSAFSTVPSAAWDAQITKTGNVYSVVGYNTDSTTAETRNLITSNDGYSYLQVGFPGALKDGGNAATSGTASGSGWAQWDLVTMTGTPHAEGYSGGLTIVGPGIFHFDPIPLSPGPLATPASTPAPAPVVTVVITPSAAPSPSPSASNSPSPSPTLTTIGASPSGGSGEGIPPWVWIALAALVVALAGVGGFLLSQRGRGSGAATPPASGAAGGAVLPTAVLPTAVPPAPGDVADTVVMKAVDPTPVETPKELPPDVV